MEGILVRYGELGIKSPPVRRRMETLLRRNMLNRMLAEGVEGDVVRMGARFWMVGRDLDALSDIAQRTFGVVSVSRATQTSSEFDAIAAECCRQALLHEWNTFAIRSRRTGHHNFTSQELAIQLGDAVWKAAEAAGRSPGVDLKNPDLEVQVDVRDKHCYVFTTQQAGPGGLPLGTQGEAAALLSDRNSLVAAWLMMRRGCKIIPIHAGDTGSIPMDGIAALARWGLPTDVEVLPVCSGVVDKQTLIDAASTFSPVVMTGDTIDSDLDVTGTLLRPVCGLVPEEVASVAERVGIPEEAAGAPLGPSKETVESLRSMHRKVSV